jgi:hypothetical protein
MEDRISSLDTHVFNWSSLIKGKGLIVKEKRFHLWYIGGVPVMHCCIINYPRLSDLKQQPFYGSS